MKALALLTLEVLLTDPACFGLETATPLQRAICRIAEGTPLCELADDDDVREAIGDVDALPNGTPTELCTIGGVRGGKSLFAAVAAVRCTQRVDVSGLRIGEVPRVSIVSLDKDKAQVVIQDHLIPGLKRSPLLRRLLIEEPKSESLLLRHPSGRPIEIAVMAGKRAGGDLVSRWSAGCIFDEAPRMQGSDDGVVNLDDARRAVVPRLLPGAMLIDVGSPWAPFGPIYELYSKHWGKPSPRVVVVRARGPVMNPVWWTPARCAELLKTNPDAYATDVDAAFLAHEESLFSNVLLERCTRTTAGDLPRDPFAAYWAAIDPATRGNSWTLVIGTRAGAKRIIACAQQWTGSSASPLSPKRVMGEVATTLARYGLREVETDQYYVDALQDHARALGLTLIQSTLDETEKTQRYLSLKTKLAEAQVELHPDATFQADLRRVKRKVTQRGISIVLPTTGNGRHCDYAPSLMLVATRNLDDVKEPPKRPVDPQTEEMRRRTLGKMQKQMRERARMGGLG